MGMNSRFDGGEIAGGRRRPGGIERTGSGGVIHTIAARGFLCAAVDGQEGNAQILPVTDDGRSDAVAAVRLFTFVPFDETVPKRARRAAAADAGECRKDGVGQAELPVRIERAGKGGKTGGAGSKTGGGGNGVFAADGQRLRCAPADMFDEGEGAAMQGAVPGCAFAVQGDAVGICRANGGTAAVAAKRDGKTAIHRQIQHTVALAPVFGERDIGGRIGGGDFDGFKTGRQVGSEVVGGGHDGFRKGLWQDTVFIIKERGIAPLFL